MTCEGCDPQPSKFFRCIYIYLGSPFSTFFQYVGLVGTMFHVRVYHYPKGTTIFRMVADFQGICKEYSIAPNGPFCKEMSFSNHPFFPTPMSVLGGSTIKGRFV